MTAQGVLVERAETLRALHVRGNPVVLPNVWDAASASALVDAGFPVVATSSGAMAAVLGYADHEETPAGEMFSAIGRICRVVDVPVTADIEAGYGLSATELVGRLLEAGAVGCNIEDTRHPSGARISPQAQAELLAAIRAAASDAGVPLVLNARIDAWLHEGDDSARFDDGVRRAGLYADAGADCVYPIGLADRDTIARFVEAVTAPVNIMWNPAGPSRAEAGRLGVARISYGTRLFREQLATFREVLSRLA